MGAGGGLAGDITAGVVARLLGVTDSRVRQLALAGDLREATRIAGRRLYRRADVERFKRERRTQKSRGRA